MPITLPELEELSDDQNVRPAPKAWREFFPGKDCCTDDCFYLHNGRAWSLFKGGFLAD